MPYLPLPLPLSPPSTSKPTSSTTCGSTISPTNETIASFFSFYIWRCWDFEIYLFAVASSWRVTERATDRRSTLLLLRSRSRSRSGMMMHASPKPLPGLTEKDNSMDRTLVRQPNWRWKPNWGAHNNILSKLDASVGAMISIKVKEELTMDSVWPSACIEGLIYA